MPGGSRSLYPGVETVFAIAHVCVHVHACTSVCACVLVCAWACFLGFPLWYFYSFRFPFNCFMEIHLYPMHLLLPRGACCSHCSMWCGWRWSYHMEGVSSNSQRCVHVGSNIYSVKKYNIWWRCGTCRNNKMTLIYTKAMWFLSAVGMTAEKQVCYVAVIFHFVKNPQNIWFLLCFCLLFPPSFFSWFF